MRRIYLDGRPHPKDFDPSYVGHSIGHWEGDTLVVDTIGFKPQAILLQEGVPHGEDARVEERYRMVAGKYLETQIDCDRSESIDGACDATSITGSEFRVWRFRSISAMKISAPYSYLEKFQELAPGRGGAPRPQPPAATPVQ